MTHRTVRRLGRVAVLGAMLAAAIPASAIPVAASGPTPAAGSCAVWSILGTQTTGRELRGVTYLAKGKALIVGDEVHTAPDRQTPWREKWTGSGFVTVKGPQPTGEESMGLENVARIDGTNTAWAIGQSSLGSRIEKYDGRRFAQSKLLTSGFLSDVDVDPSGRAWAVGTSDPYGTPKPMIMRNTGGAWTKVTLPAALPSGALTDVFARTTKDAWALGLRADTAGAVVLHWNGTAWKRLKAWAKPAGVQFQIAQGIASNGAGRAVVVGSENTGSESRAFSMIWDGSAWARQEVPANSFGLGGLAAITVTPDGTYYAVGARYDGDQNQALIVRSTGGAWTRMPFNSPTPILLADIAARSNGELMAVGSPGLADKHRTVLRCTPA